MVASQVEVDKASLGYFHWERIFEEEERIYVSYSVGSSVGEGYENCEGSSLVESLGIEFLIEVVYSLGL